MSILIDETTRVLVQGITGAQARFDTEWCLKYGTRIVAGVTPGRGGERVHAVPVYDSVARALSEQPLDASIVYAPGSRVKQAVLEAIDAGVALIAVTAEFVPQHDVIDIVAAARARGIKLVGCNTNGVISPGKSKIGGVGGMDPSEIYAPGRIGVCSRSGGMPAEIGLALRAAGYGISTSVAMGGDRVTGLGMADYLLMFEQDPDTQAVVLFGEPGTSNEHDVAALLASGRIRKPVLALIAGVFQEAYPRGMSFGHAAAMIDSQTESVTAKRKALADAGALIATTLEDIARLLGEAHVAPQQDAQRC